MQLAAQTSNPKSRSSRERASSTRGSSSNTKTRIPPGVATSVPSTKHALGAGLGVFAHFRYPGEMGRRIVFAALLLATGCPSRDGGRQDEPIPDTLTGWADPFVGTGG